MAYKNSLSSFSFLLLLVFILAINVNGDDLKLGFYEKTCPKVEAIVQKTTADKISLAPSLAAPLLRMHFHDCFVRGCDGSVLIDSIKNNQAEKDGFPNLSLRGFQIIDDVKIAVEDACPNVVSCADILALVARDAIYQIKGPYWPVPLGRKDGRVSIASESLTLPSPFANIAQLKAQFAFKGLSVKDLVVLSAEDVGLSGAEDLSADVLPASAFLDSRYILHILHIGGHTVGTSHCSTIAIRLYNFTGKGDTDPSLDSDYFPYLKSKCKPTDTTTLLEMDPGSFRTFDENYYTNVLKRRGLFVSDDALLSDDETSAYVKLQAQSHGSTFLKDFQESMVKMGKIGVLTGSAGEIRRHCRLIN